MNYVTCISVHRVRRAQYWASSGRTTGRQSLTSVAGEDARSRSIRIAETGRNKQVQAQRAIDEKLGAKRMSELKSLMDESLAILATEH